MGCFLALFLAAASLPAQKPVLDARQVPHEYHGPGRDAPVPVGLSEIRIGYFGPSDPAHPEGADLWRAAQLAQEEINAAGGPLGLPLRLLPAWSDNPWGTGISTIVRMSYEEGIWALLGGFDGPTAHLAEQAVAKARLALVNPAATDRTANLAHVPWIFSCLPGEDLQVSPLMKAIAAVAGSESVLLSSTSHDSRVFAAEFLREASRLGLSPRFHFEFDRTKETDVELLDNGRVKRARAFVIVAGPLESAWLLQQVRRVSESPVFGTASMGRQPFLETAGPQAEGVVFPFPADLDGVLDFSARFARRWQREADFACAQTYDALFLLARAIDRSGLNRVRIRDALRELSGYQGSAGTVIWDATGQNLRPTRLATVSHGRVVYWMTDPGR